jgi:hypothetical protein
VLPVLAKPIIVPEEGAEQWGLQPAMVKRKQDQGGGFAVLVEGFHHLHCLNLLRQATWFNYDYYRDLGEGPFVNEENILKVHVSKFGHLFFCSRFPSVVYHSVEKQLTVRAAHCMDILRQQLMCTVDTSVFGQWFVEDVGAFVDFNTVHRCKNFEDIKDWVVSHQLSDNGTDKVQRRPGDKLLPEIP